MMPDYYYTNSGLPSTADMPCRSRLCNKGVLTIQFKPAHHPYTLHQSKRAYGQPLPLNTPRIGTFMKGTRSLILVMFKGCDSPAPKTNPEPAKKLQAVQVEGKDLTDATSQTNLISMKKDMLLIFTLVVAAFCVGWLLCRRFADLEHSNANVATRVTNLEARLVPVEKDHQYREYRGRIWDKVKGLIPFIKAL
jgi:hypothetical protein